MSPFVFFFSCFCVFRWRPSASGSALLPRPLASSLLRPHLRTWGRWLYGSHWTGGFLLLPLSIPASLWRGRGLCTHTPAQTRRLRNSCSLPTSHPSCVCTSRLFARCLFPRFGDCACLARFLVRWHGPVPAQPQAREREQRYSNVAQAAQSAKVLEAHAQGQRGTTDTHSGVSRGAAVLTAFEHERHLKRAEARLAAAQQRLLALALPTWAWLYSRGHPAPAALF